MYYHLQIYDKTGHHECKINLYEDELAQRIIQPYENGVPIVVNGRTIKQDQIDRIRIFETDSNLNAILKKLEKEYDDDQSPYKMLGDSPIWKAIETGHEVTDKYITGAPGHKGSSKLQVKEFKINPTKKVFISHSSKDKKVVGELIDLLEAIGLKSSQIFCSSFEGYGIPLGADFLARLKSELDSEIIVLFILSKNFYGSPISLCEMGATWIKTNKHIPILIPPFQFEDIKGVFPLTQGMLIDDKDKLNSLKEALELDFNLTPIRVSIWEKKRETFLKKINELKEDEQVATDTFTVPETDLDYTRHQLTDEAKMLLKEASLDAAGEIVKLGYIGGFTFQTNGKQMNEDYSPRTKARWEAAFNELLDFDLIYGVGIKEEIFHLTEKGYRVADKLN